MLIEHYQTVRAYTESLCQPLNLEDYVPQAAEFVSPPKWHLAHVTWFFETMILSKYVDDYVVFNTDFHFLFNSYYQSLGDRVLRCQRGLITRPTVEEVFAYRHYVDQHMLKLIASAISDELYALIVLGLNHEQQHQELLLTDLKYNFSFNSTYPVYDQSDSSMDDENTEQGWLPISEGIYDIGYKGDGFCFDNELGRHKVYLQNYEISKSLVSNKEYLEFIDDGGYEKFQYWLDEGWSWVKENDIQAPLYWELIDDEWHCYTLSGLKKINKNAMLSHISFYEANAFANWKGLRLPTEFEWEAASGQLSWGKRWEWTSSAYQPYPGFTIRPGAVGEYNGKFMVNQMVLRGASVVTPASHQRDTYRNFFHPFFQWQYTGVRLVR